MIYFCCISYSFYVFMI